MRPLVAVRSALRAVVRLVHSGTVHASSTTCPTLPFRTCPSLVMEPRWTPFILVMLVEMQYLGHGVAALSTTLLCNAAARGFISSRHFEIAGVYFRLFPRNRCVPVKPSDVEFQVFPNKMSLNADHENITVQDASQKLRSFFDPEMPTAVYVHGFLEGKRGASSRAFKAAFLQRGDYNFMSVDWHQLATGPWYLSASNNVVFVSNELAGLLDRLIEVGAIRLNTLHLIGFSLGAHVCGMAAQRLRAGRVPRITGLDPAYPLFDELSLDERLDSSDADFVDVVHTSGGLYGYSEPLGHVDFYPNSGNFMQPGCEIVLIPGTCSHWRAWRFFEESLRGGEFIATLCDSWSKFANGRCRNNPKVMMGINTNHSARGKFYLRTNWAAPYSVF